METAICLKCGPQPVDSFGKNKNRVNGLQAWCSSCKKDYNKTHYQNNKSTYAERTAVSQKALRDEINGLKESTPCKDCGKFYPHYVMDFDHVRGTKVFNLSKAHAYSKDEVKAELDKC